MGVSMYVCVRVCEYVYDYIHVNRYYMCMLQKIKAP